MSFGNFSNRTTYGLEPAAARYCWSAWFLFVLIVSVLGDTTILIASTRGGAFKLIKINSVFIQHIAVSDLLICLTYVFPSFVSMLCDGWVFGEVLCYVRVYVGFMVLSVSSLLVFVMSVVKYARLEFPFRTLLWGKSFTHKVCAVVWISTVGCPLSYLVIDRFDIVFDYRIYNCIYNFSAPTWKYVLPVMALFSKFLPNVLIVIANVLILLKAIKMVRVSDRRRNERMKWEGTLTVIMTALVYTLSFFPFILYHMVEMFMSSSSADEDGRRAMVQFYRTVCSIVLFNVFSNFFIYSFTMEGFRAYLRARIRRICRRDIESQSRQHPRGVHAGRRQPTTGPERPPED